MDSTCCLRNVLDVRPNWEPSALQHPSAETIRAEAAEVAGVGVGGEGTLHVKPALNALPSSSLGFLPFLLPAVHQGGKLPLTYLSFLALSRFVGALIN